jgi:enoyl-CoA hydratase
LKAADGVAAGVATHRVASDRFADVLDALCSAVPVDAVLAAFSEPAPAEPRYSDGSATQTSDPSRPQPTWVGGGEIMARRGAIDRIFAADSVEDILHRLDAEASTGSGDAAWARATAATIRANAPLSLKIALTQMRRGRDWSFEECMRAEFRIVSRVAYGEDFYEGIRAVIIDKDNRPRWRPATLAEVTPEMVERHFAPLPAELPLP